jgi:hypothetical protein
VFVLDAYILILVMRVRGAGQARQGEQQQQQPGQPPAARAGWRPHPDSRLWRELAAVRQSRRVTPHVEVVEEGSEGAALFESLLIDDDDDDDDDDDEGEGQEEGGEGGPGGRGAAAGPRPGGRGAFELHIRAEVALQLQPR